MAARAVDREFDYIVLGLGLPLASFEVSLGSLGLSFGNLWGRCGGRLGLPLVIIWWFLVCLGPSLGAPWAILGWAWARGICKGSKERFDCKFIWFGEKINSIA